MKLYRITGFGHQAARSVSAPDTEEWRVLRFIDRMGQASDEQVAGGTGLPSDTVRAIAGRLKRKRNRRGDALIDEV